MASLEERCLVTVPPVTAFEFFLRPQRVIDISDPSVGLRLVDGPDVFAHGDQFHVELIAFGTVRKVMYEAGVDRDTLTISETMIEGDLQAWTHTKRFEVEANGCHVVDQIDFEPPGGLAGFLMTADKIAASVADGIAYRNERLSDALLAFAGELG